MIERPNIPHYGCYHPILVNGDYKPCGKCKACQISRTARKSSAISDLYQSEDISNGYLVTYTWDNEHLPLLEITEDIVGDVSYINTGYSLTHAHIYTSKYEHFSDALCKANRALRTSKTKHLFDQYDGKIVGVINYREFAEYLHALSKRQARRKHAKYRYLYAGEYGPQTLRPHIHSILLFPTSNSKRDFFNEFRYLKTTKSGKKLYTSPFWPYGHIQISPLTQSNTNACSDYLSNYLCSSTNLFFDMLRLRSVKPKVVKSRNFGVCAKLQASLWHSQILTLWRQNRFVHNAELYSNNQRHDIAAKQHLIQCAPYAQFPWKNSLSFTSNAKAYKLLSQVFLSPQHLKYQIKRYIFDKIINKELLKERLCKVEKQNLTSSETIITLTFIDAKTKSKNTKIYIYEESEPDYLKKQYPEQPYQLDTLTYIFDLINIQSIDNFTCRTNIDDYCLRKAYQISSYIKHHSFLNDKSVSDIARYFDLYERSTNLIKSEHYQDKLTQLENESFTLKNNQKELTYYLDNYYNTLQNYESDLHNQEKNYHQKYINDKMLTKMHNDKHINK